MQLKSAFYGEREGHGRMRQGKGQSIKNSDLCGKRVQVGKTNTYNSESEMPEGLLEIASLRNYSEFLRLVSLVHQTFRISICLIILLWSKFPWLFYNNYRPCIILPGTLACV